MSSSGTPSGTEGPKGRPPKGQMIPERLPPGTPEKIRRTVAKTMGLARSAVMTMHNL